jgi:hypothetical protein
METIDQINKRRNENLHTLTEIEVAGNTIVKIKPTDGYLLTKYGSVYTTHTRIMRNGKEYWKPTDAKTIN